VFFSLKPRERLLIALRHEEPDRIPIDLGSTGVTGINVFVYRDLRKLLNLPSKPIRVADFLSQIAEVEKEVLDTLHVDVINIERTLPPAYPMEISWKLWTHRDGTLIEIPAKDLVVWAGTTFTVRGEVSIVRREDGYYAYINNMLAGIMPLQGYYFEPYTRVRHIRPVKDAKIPYIIADEVKSIEDVKKLDWDRYKISDEEIDIMRKRAEYLYKNTEYGLVVARAYQFHEWGQHLRGWSTWLSDLRLRKPLAEAILDHMMDVVMYNVKRVVDAVGEYVQVMSVIHDDLGTEEGPQISPQIFREFYKHRYEEVIGYIKRHSKAYIFFHSCGSIFPLIKELIDVGIDILNPVQISAKGMDPERLKKEYGEQITFWGGGADNQHILPLAKPEEVAEHVKKLIKIFAPKGGFVYAQIHNINPPTPAENVLTAFKTAYEYGKYPIR